TKGAPSDRLGEPRSQRQFAYFRQSLGRRGGVVGTMDAITMQVIGGRLASIAAEMSQKMIRMSFSILIKESEDIGCAITDADGNQLAEADTSPLQMGPIPFYVRGAKRILAE